VLSQKWAILYLLYQLADSNPLGPCAGAGQMPLLSQDTPQNNLGIALPGAEPSPLNAGIERVAR